MAELLNSITDEIAADICGAHNNQPEALLEILRSIQEKSGYVSDVALITISKRLNISRAETHGVMSFYHDFKSTADTGPVIKICRAEACQAVGSEELYEQLCELPVIQSNQARLADVYCLGNCALGPAIMIDKTLYGRVTVAMIKSRLEELSAEQA